MDYDGALDAPEWFEVTPAEVVRLVLGAIGEEPTPRALPGGCRAQRAPDHNLTALVVAYCQDDELRERIR
jgi:hypothetical protein